MYLSGCEKRKMLPFLVGMEEDAASWKLERELLKRLNTNVPKNPSAPDNLKK